MSPIPRADRLNEYARKGVELALRQIAQAPEQRAARRLASGDPKPANGAPKVLVLSPRDWAAHVQVESMLAHALQLRGAAVEFLTCGGGLEICDRANTYEAPPMPCTTCTRYVAGSLDAHGFQSTSIRAGWTLDDPPWPEIDALSLDGLFTVEDGRRALGRAIEIPLKWFLCAASLDDEPLAGQTARAFLRSARRIARGIDEALEEIRPDTVLILNGLFLFEAVAWEICKERGIDVVTYERAFRKDTLVFSRDVPAGFYDLSAQWATENRPLLSAESNELDAYLATRRRGGAFDQYWSFTKGESVHQGDGRLVVLFTNLTWDTAVIGRDLAFPDIRGWIDAVIAAFADRPEHQLVIRVHPSEVALPGKRTRDSLEQYVVDHHPELPANVRVVGATETTSSYDLIDAADLVLVYTSTTGLEVALSGKPVIVSGAVHYRGKGFTVDVSSPAEFLAQLDEGLAKPEALHGDVETARRYAHYFFFRGPVAAPLVTEPLPGLARLSTDEAADLAPGASAAVDRICDLILAGPTKPTG
ncbi:MAG: hypothetical protein QOI61_2219 [Actinomycetota bacterium]|jgi:hypothetical protein